MNKRSLLRRIYFELLPWMRDDWRKPKRSLLYQIAAIDDASPAIRRAGQMLSKAMIDGFSTTGYRWFDKRGK